MIATAVNPERLAQTRQNLNALRAQGYRYVVTLDDGESWIGSRHQGLDIDELIFAGFIGHISLEEPL